MTWFFFRVEEALEPRIQSPRRGAPASVSLLCSEHNYVEEI